MASSKQNYRPTPSDGLHTHTSLSQLDVETALSPLFEFSKAEDLTLNRNAHLNFAVRLTMQGLASRYTAYDASQPWLLFWNLQTFQTLGVAFDPFNKKRAIDSVLRMQNPDGGFGGGPGQDAHLLANYAAVCTLAIVGSPGPEGGWDQINRKKMYEWFMRLKQPDGSFLVSRSGEVDMRGIYCLLVVATLLDLLTEELARGLRAFVASCQTYEGGFSAASQPYYTSFPPNSSSLLEHPRPSLGEAHGGYTFCALASLVLLEPVDPLPSSTSRKWMGIDVYRLYRWASGMQGLASEGGGFRGRTNKLVDGCYSWWVGGLFPLLDDILGKEEKAAEEELVSPAESGSGTDNEWDDHDDGLFNRQALQEFVLISSQADTGGLRDKPGRQPDSYHTLYNLSGLSSAQHRVHRTSESKKDRQDKWKTPTVAEGSTSGNEPWRQAIYVASMAWAEDEPAARFVGGKGNRMNATHPVFDLTMTAAKGVMDYFYGQIAFDN